MAREGRPAINFSGRDPSEPPDAILTQLPDPSRVRAVRPWLEEEGVRWWMRQAGQTNTGTARGVKTDLCVGGVFFLRLHVKES